MYGLTDYERYEAICSLPFSGDMLPSAMMSKMLSLLLSGHEACFFLCGSFLKCLPADFQSHLVHEERLTLSPWLSVPMKFIEAEFPSLSELLLLPMALPSTLQPRVLPSARPFAPPSASRCSDSPDLC